MGISGFVDTAEFAPTAEERVDAGRRDRLVLTHLRRVIRAISVICVRLNYFTLNFRIARIVSSICIVNLFVRYVMPAFALFIRIVRVLAVDICRYMALIARASAV